MAPKINSSGATLLKKATYSWDTESLSDNRSTIHNWKKVTSYAKSHKLAFYIRNKDVTRRETHFPTLQETEPELYSFPLSLEMAYIHLTEIKIKECALVPVWRPAHLLSPSARQRLLPFPIGPRRRRGGVEGWAGRRRCRERGVSTGFEHNETLYTCEDVWSVTHHTCHMFYTMALSPVKAVSLRMNQSVRGWKNLIVLGLIPTPLLMRSPESQSLFSLSSRRTCEQSVECKWCTAFCATECHLIQVF